MRKLIVTFLTVYGLMVAMMFAVAAQPAIQVSKWEHSSNPQRGMSLMTMGQNLSTNEVAIMYDVPRTSLLDIGIRPGMILFQGVRAGDTFTGQAFVFACGQSWPYRVTGYYSDGRLRLQGPAPIIERDYNGRCYVDRLSYNDRNANLMFWFRGMVQ